MQCMTVGYLKWLCLLENSSADCYFITSNYACASGVLICYALVLISKLLYVGPS